MWWLFTQLQTVLKQEILIRRPFLRKIYWLNNEYITFLWFFHVNVKYKPNKKFPLTIFYGFLWNIYTKSWTRMYLSDIKKKFLRSESYQAKWYLASIF